MALTLNQQLEAFSGTKVLVTGHTGFKGSWLTLWLRHLGAQVIGVALPPHTLPSLFDSGRVADGIRDYNQDIREFEQLLAIVVREKPDLIMHLAAQPLVRQSYELARETYDINVMGSVHVFECAKRVDSVRALVHVSTDKCYLPTEKKEGYSEDDPLGGHDPYSASKAAAEVAFLSYLDSFYRPHGRVMAASGRAGNVIGGGDWAEDRIVPDAMRALSMGYAIPVRNPASVRPWQHVLEALSGYLTLGASLLRAEGSATGGWNFGPNDESAHPVQRLVEGVIGHWGSGVAEHAVEEGAVHEAGYLKLQCTKARSELNWSPRWGFDDTVEKTTQWYKEFYEGKDARELCLQDITDYMGAAVVP